jgi:hypothetical protein
MAHWVPGPWRARGGGRSVQSVHGRRVMLYLAVRVRMLDTRGQTAAEYLGLLLLVAAIITALLVTGPGQAIGDKLSQIVRDIAGDR